MELDSQKIQRLVNDVYKVGILDLLSYGPQSNAVMLQHLLGGLTKGEFLFQEATPFTPALAELVSAGEVIAFSLAVGDAEVSFALPEDVDPELVHFMPLDTLNREAGKNVTDTSCWRASLVSLGHRGPFTPVPRGDNPRSVEDIMSSIMGGDMDIMGEGDDNE